MKSARLHCLLLLSASLLALSAGARAAEPEALVGPVTREQIEAASPEWVRSEVEAAPDAAAAQALATVEPGAEVTVFLGTWCGDSRREVPRLWKALDAAGGTVPFHIRYIGVDREKKEPAADVDGSGIRFVPTLIVSRGGHELGRIVEQPPHGVEKDLLALLKGEAHGVVSGSHPEAPARPPSPN
jgi:thiol-disulfide isomerase/thioredoxin